MNSIKYLPREEHLLQIALDVEPNLSLDPRVVSKTGEAKERALNQLQTAYEEYKHKNQPLGLTRTLKAANYCTAYAPGEFKNLPYEKCHKLAEKLWEKAEVQLDKEKRMSRAGKRMSRAGLFFDKLGNFFSGLEFETTGNLANRSASRLEHLRHSEIDEFFDKFKNTENLQDKLAALSDDEIKACVRDNIFHLDDHGLQLQFRFLEESFLPEQWKVFATAFMDRPDALFLLSNASEGAKKTLIDYLPHDKVAQTLGDLYEQERSKIYSHKRGIKPDWEKLKTSLGIQPSKDLLTRIKNYLFETPANKVDLRSYYAEVLIEDHVKKRDRSELDEKPLESIHDIENENLRRGKTVSSEFGDAIREKKENSEKDFFLNEETKSAFFATDLGKEISRKEEVITKE